MRVFPGNDVCWHACMSVMVYFLIGSVISRHSKALSLLQVDGIQSNWSLCDSHHQVQ